jgi:putative nucleotidyltransferase with HDIG domain
MTARAVIVEHVRLHQYLAVPFRRVFAHFAVAGVGGIALWVVNQRLGIILTAMTAWVIGQLYYPVKILADKRQFSLGILGAIASAVDLKDPYTARHSRNVAEYSAKVARRLGLPEDEVERIRLGALLHDIGKIGVGGRIIRKPGILDPEERLTMQAHVDRSADLLEPLALVGEAAEIVRAHHEHYDGTGYPRGLRGEDIPLGARIILVADAFDAMTTDRPYRRGRLPREALQALRAHAGRQFDPAVVQALDQIISE